MTFIEWVYFFFALQAIHFAGTWKLYQRAGYSAWKAIVPIYNAMILMRIINRPQWWVILLFIPIINVIIFPVIWVETIRSFGKNQWLDTVLALLTLGFYTYYVNYALNVKHLPERSPEPKTAFGEWVSSILFAVVIATLVHTYFIQPYIIPTGSLEKSLLIGDFLFVSKFHYGARTPQTAISFPMVHDTIVGTGIRSYLNKPQIPYFRLPKIQKVKRNDIVVFSWPADTVRQFFVKEKGVTKPMDKKSNYVKRCVALPGDTFEIVDGIIHINESPTVLPDRAKPQYSYSAYNRSGISSRKLINEGVSDLHRKFIIKNISLTIRQALSPYILGFTNENTVVTGARGIPLAVIRRNGIQAQEIKERKKMLFLTRQKATELRKTTLFDSLKRDINTLKTYNTTFFPNDNRYNWNIDNFGPIIMPEKGTTVQLTPENIPLYKKIIRDYEHNKLIIKGNKFVLNGVQTTQYTFKQDYYWMMGDNRHQSEDSRFWGFVPADHIVGKPVFIWMSIDGINDGIKNWKIRWERVFTTVGLEGKPVSYRWHFLAVFLIWQGVVFYRKSKRKNAP